ncbi:MAG: YfcE family phosphodiesterase [Candidatus Brocadiia bacterium]
MKLLVLSDSHGKKFEDISPLFPPDWAECDAVVHCGDIESMSFLDSLYAYFPTAYVVRGNCDKYDHEDLPGTLLFRVGSVCVAVVHGNSARHTPHGLIASFLPERPDLLLFGHTHRRFAEVVEGVLCINPGSVARPRDGRASLAVVEILGTDIQYRFEYL